MFPLTYPQSALLTSCFGEKRTRRTHEAEEVSSVCPTAKPLRGREQVSSMIIPSIGALRRARPVAKRLRWNSHRSEFNPNHVSGVTIPIRKPPPPPKKPSSVFPSSHSHQPRSSVYLLANITIAKGPKSHSVTNPPSARSPSHDERVTLPVQVIRALA